MCKAFYIAFDFVLHCIIALDFVACFAYCVRPFRLLLILFCIALHNMQGVLLLLTLLFVLHNGQGADFVVRFA